MNLIQKIFGVSFIEKCIKAIIICNAISVIEKFHYHDQMRSRIIYVIRNQFDKNDPIINSVKKDFDKINTIDDFLKLWSRENDYSLTSLLQQLGIDEDKYSRVCNRPIADVTEDCVWETALS